MDQSASARQGLSSPLRGKSNGRKCPFSSTRLLARVNGRHFMASHSLVSVRCIPTSTLELAFNSFAACRTQAPGIIISMLLAIPSVHASKHPIFELQLVPASSTRTSRRFGLFVCLASVGSSNAKLTLPLPSLLGQHLAKPSHPPSLLMSSRASLPGTCPCRGTCPASLPVF